MVGKKRNPISEIREIRSAIRAAKAATVAAKAAAEKVAAQTAADKAAAAVAADKAAATAEAAAAELKAKAEAGIITLTLSGKPEDLNRFRFQGTQVKAPSAEIVSGLSWASATASLNYIANKIISRKIIACYGLGSFTPLDFIISVFYVQAHQQSQKEAGIIPDPDFDTFMKITIFEKGYEKDPAIVAKEAIQEATRNGSDVLVDTAGRMTINN
ncbi:uncharacterized protein LOC110894189 [Helianthus annuus]|uniref:uncharacterized protein LOC110894189 n=1 Tax=Helianthus annuus TaxID=4232 RepID=UPI000B8F9867|nr:uncharacterized protein LOC110894189 [Helianthus annuus]